MNELQIFSNPEFGSVRCIEKDGEEWFVGTDVAKALGYAKPHGALDKHVDKDDSLIWGVLDSRGCTQKTKLINESGLYSLIILSELPSARKFKKWITSEVIPSIRKTGGYGVPQMSQSELILKIAQNNLELEHTASCNLSARQSRLKGRMERAGATYAERQAITKIDVISRDDKLKAIFDGIVKKYMAKYVLAETKTEKPIRRC